MCCEMMVLGEHRKLEWVMYRSCLLPYVGVWRCCMPRVRLRYFWRLELSAGASEDGWRRYEPTEI